MSINQLIDDWIGLTSDLTEEEWNWCPDPRGPCECRHSDLWHQLKEPHLCNECKECTGYVRETRN